MKYTTINIRSYEIHDLVLREIAPNSHILELGCATGYFSKALKLKNCLVTGVEYEKEAANIAAKVCDEVIIADLEKIPNLSPKSIKYNTVLLMDVIEHIMHRRELLTSIQKYISPNGTLILTTPNIAHLAVRLNLLCGNFTYTHQGIMDETHVHFFTRKTLLKLLDESGYEIKKIDGSADFGLIPIFGKLLRHTPKIIQYKITHIFSTLLTGQWLVIAALKK